ncbi:MAG TPA: hypothetical protein PLM82_12380 [Candidatus Latescibacteria bacterium]|nr:hypothetical protein [Candidatus Latescibacterota bacterium]
MANDKITLEIGAKDLASGVFGRVTKASMAFGVAMGNLASKAITAGINGLRRWINEALEAEKANVMLDAALRGTGRYTPVLAAQFRDLANAIQDETGASDESAKANIALLTTLGVAPDKMSTAARGMQALTALNIEGSMAARALARALEGDFAGFDRLSPAVRLATTDQEKALAISNLLKAGYEQQRATLQTVGGAWAALKGRLGDAREDLIGAVFEGLNLGKTFDSMQAKVGAFLKSESFKGITDRLRESAAFAKDIFSALTTKGTASESFSLIGDLIVAAFYDGSKIVGNAILNGFKLGVKEIKEWAFGKQKEKLPQGDVNGEVVGFDFAAHQRARALQDTIPDTPQKEQTEVQKVLAKMADLRKRHLEALQKQVDYVEDGAADEAERLQNEQIQNDLLTALKEKQVQAACNALVMARQKAAAQARVLAAEQELAAAVEKERAAAQAAEEATAKRKEIQGMSVRDWINKQQAGRTAEDEAAKERVADAKRASALSRKRKAGTKLSKRDAEWLNDFEGKPKAEAAAKKAEQDAIQKANQAAIKAEEARQRVEDLQKRTAIAVEAMQKDLAQSMRVE